MAQKSNVNDFHGFESHHASGGLALECSHSISDTSMPVRKGAFRKLLTNKRLLMVKMKQLSTKLRSAKTTDSSALISKFEEIKTFYDEFNETISAISDPAEINELTDGVANQYEQCVNLVDKLMSKFFNNPSNVEENDADEVEPSDSVSQVGNETAASWITASTSASVSVRQIEVKRKRTELLAKRELELARAQAEVEAKVKAAEVEAKVKAAEIKAEAKAKAAEAEARF